MPREIEYDLRSLEDSIEHRRKTIDTLKQAISIEQENIANERRLIEVIERKQALSEGIVIDAQSDD